MKLVTYDGIKNANITVIPIDYSDTLLNFVKEYRHKVYDLQEITKVAMQFLDKDTRNYYTWWCVNEGRHLMKDKRSVEAVDILKLYIDGKASIEELEVANEYAAIARDACAANLANYGSADDGEWYYNYFAACAAYYASAVICVSDADVYYVANSAANSAWYIHQSNKQHNLQIDKLIEILESK
jgi:hypothetical protein